MSSLIPDVAIWILLIVGVGFSVISVIGLLLFPDIKSRRFTSVRAGLIASGATLLSVIIYGSYLLVSSGQNQYMLLISHIILLAIVIAIGNYVISEEILARSIRPSSCGKDPKKARDP